MRVFETGATRDGDEEKLDYEGFESPFVLERFAQYMHEHRKQSDGSLRDSDNWQRGIPPNAYMKSLIRHVIDLWKIHRGKQATQKEKEDLACAIRFNASGYLFELLNDHPPGVARPGCVPPNTIVECTPGIIRRTDQSSQPVDRVLQGSQEGEEVQGPKKTCWICGAIVPNLSEHLTEACTGKLKK